LDLNQWRHIAVTYDGKRKASGVRIYVDGEEWEKEVLYDDLSFPLSTEEPFRIGAGGGPQNRFTGSIDDVRAYSGAMSRVEVGTLAELKTIAEIAAMPAAERSAVQHEKLRAAFLDQYAPREVEIALRKWREAHYERDQFYESIPTVMVMNEMETPVGRVGWARELGERGRLGGLSRAMDGRREPLGRGHDTPRSNPLIVLRRLHREGP
jgi:hypothetical protein